MEEGKQKETYKREGKKRDMQDANTFVAKAKTTLK